MRRVLDGEFLSRTSNIVASYQPGLSYQPELDLSKMRYGAVDVVRVKPGRAADFSEGWRAIVEAHKTAMMDEHWRVYQVQAGMPDGTFLFFFAMPDMATFDRSGPMHGADAYRNAVGETGRARLREMQVEAVDSSQRLLFRLSPQLSSLPAAWTDADPFWVPKLPAPAAAPAKPTAEKPGAGAPNPARWPLP